ncbi:mycofactocin-coupled SDR family oxidoreductase [Rhizohabitans arisaemae]|uniref:mycofactocin-coupled SDR family oxidoreductase n=1 Tax=Rhizohabitans arisaemae TaxID=2720610 RepID=UPI0024B10567|nr:mycofactocin-coupled SDR family oxidoreductase [Rhizohabitans arisaemae]
MTGGRLAGRVALVTGAARGQGKAHAVRLAQEGADIIATDLDVPDLSAEVESCGRRLVARAADVREAEGLRAAVADGVAEFGRLDVVVANAGVAQVAPSLSPEAEDVWRLALEVNLTGVWNTCRATLPYLIEGGRGGSMIITGSTQAYKSTPGTAAYSATKTGVLGLMRALAIEYAEHMIRINSVHPTTVWTPMLAELSPDGMSEEELREFYRPVNGLPVPWVEPEDVSAAVAFLASDDARYITGTALPVDAGALLVGGRAKRGGAS